jgi:hypothetical protein
VRNPVGDFDQVATPFPAPVCLQMAQLNQATADARILGEVLQHAAESTARLAQELDEARRQTLWTEEAANKRVSVLAGSCCWRLPVIERSCVCPSAVDSVRFKHSPCDSLKHCCC